MRGQHEGSDRVRLGHPETCGHHQTDLMAAGIQTPSPSGHQNLESLHKCWTPLGQECFYGQILSLPVNPEYLGWTGFGEACTRTVPGESRTSRYMGGVSAWYPTSSLCRLVYLASSFVSVVIPVLMNPSCRLSLWISFPDDLFAFLFPDVLLLWVLAEDHRDTFLPCLKSKKYMIINDTRS